MNTSSSRGDSMMSTVKSFVGMKNGSSKDGKANQKEKMKRSEDFSEIYMFNSPHTYFK
jgi:hypothetical protein